MVSIIIPVLNEAAILEGTLRRLAELQPLHELIVVDGGSVDDTLAIASDCTTPLVALRGRARQMNCGATQASGDILLFLHADTWLERDALNHVEQAVAKGYVGGAFSQVIEGEHFLYRLIERAGDFRARRLRLFYGDSGIFVTRLGFEKIGGFPEVLIGEEFAFSRALRQIGSTTLLPIKIHISPRRWERRGIVRTTLLNWCITALWHLRVPPGRLARLYGNVR